MDEGNVDDTVAVDDKHLDGDLMGANESTEQAHRVRKEAILFAFMKTDPPR